MDAELHEFADVRGVTYDKLCAELKECYDGYHFTHNSIGMYNPCLLYTSTNTGKQLKAEVSIIVNIVAESRWGTITNYAAGNAVTRCV